MDYIPWIIIGGASAIGFYMAWSIGANDVANSMATAVGAKAITFKQAVIIAGILNFIGAVFVGSHVTETVKKGIIHVDTIPSHVLLLGFIASLLAAAIWVTLSTWKEMPISTTHSVIGALIGFGIIAAGVTSVNWGKVGFVAASWVLSPVFGCILAFIVFKIIVKTIFAKENPVKSAKIVGPIVIGLTAFLIVSSLLLKTSICDCIGVAGDYYKIILISFVISVIVIFIAIYLLKDIEAKCVEDYATVEGIFRKLQVVTSCYVAFAHGANDVANAIGPVAAIVPLSQGISITSEVEVPVYLLALGGIGISIGCLTWGRRVMKTVGSRITSLTNTRGFSVDFGAATTVLIASKLGLPISTSHTVVGAVIGVGLARGLEAVDLSIIKKIIVSWILTLPIAAGTSIVIFLILRGIIG